MQGPAALPDSEVIRLVDEHRLHIATTASAASHNNAYNAGWFAAMDQIPEHLRFPDAVPDADKKVMSRNEHETAMERSASKMVV